MTSSAKAPATLIRVRQLLSDLFAASGGPLEFKDQHDGNSYTIVAHAEHGTWVLTEEWILTFHLGGDFTVTPYLRWVDEDPSLVGIAKEVHETVVEFTHNTFPTDQITPPTESPS